MTQRGGPAGRSRARVRRALDNNGPVKDPQQHRATAPDRGERERRA